MRARWRRLARLPTFREAEDGREFSMLAAIYERATMARTLAFPVAPGGVRIGLGRAGKTDAA